MTVEQLISKLNEFPQDTRVQIRDTYFGYYEPHPYYDSSKKIVQF